MCGWVLQRSARPCAFNGPIVSLRIVSAAAAPCRISEDMQPARNYKGPALCGGLFSATLFMSGEERWEKGEPAGNPPRSCNQGSLRSHMKDGLISGGLLLVGRSEEMVGSVRGRGGGT